MKKCKCEKCYHGFINFWGYPECWKFEKRIDTVDTRYTAEREIDATTFNWHGACKYYIPKWLYLFCEWLIKYFT